MRNIKMILEYDGTDYHGWQIQDREPTIQEIIEDRLKSITKETIRTISSGRTDAGVHALGQVINFYTKSSMDNLSFLKAINSLLPRDIAVKEVMDVPLDFHARFSAKSKSYKYLILNSPIRNAFYERYSWHIPYRLDLELMKEASDYIEGTHDFSTFRASSCGARNPIRTILGSNIERIENLIEITIEANAFLQYMVRNIIGTLIEVGRKKIRPIDLKLLIEKKDRKKAGSTSPPHGLFLLSVSY